MAPSCVIFQTLLYPCQKPYNIGTGFTEVKDTGPIMPYKVIFRIYRLLKLINCNYLALPIRMTYLGINTVKKRCVQPTMV